MVQKNNNLIELKRSGDDIVFFPKKEITSEGKREIIKELLRLKNPSIARFVFIDQKSKPEERVNISLVGEEIEKKFKALILGVSKNHYPINIANNIILAVDMPPIWGEGKINFYLGVKLSDVAPSDLKKLKLNIIRSLDLINEKRADNPMDYTLGKVFVETLSKNSYHF